MDYYRLDRKQHDLEVVSKILIDVGKINDPFVGLGQVTAQFAGALLDDPRKPDDWDYYFGVKSGDIIPEQLQHSNIYKLRAAGRYFPRVNKGFDIWHSIHQDSDWVPAHGIPFILTIHDFNFLYEKGEVKSGIRLNRIGAKIHKAAAITTISKFTSEELKRYFPEIAHKVHVIYNGVNPPHINIPQKPAGVPEDKPYLFCISYFSPKKNLETLLHMMVHLPDKNLILAGDHETAYGQSLKKLAQELKLQNIYFTGKVTPSEKSWLFSHAESLVFPSLYEGFGLPVIEAFLAGLPVMTSACTALPEIGGGHAGIWENFNPMEMARAYLAYIHQDTPHAREERLNFGEQFSWEQHVSKMKQLYSEILKKT